MVQSGKVDVCMLQETKVSKFTLSLVKEFWGGKDVEWTHLDSNGASGGSVILWRNNSLELLQSFKGMGFVGMKVICKGSCINFVNVYACCNRVLRKEM